MSLPQQLAGLRIQRNQLGVERAHVQRTAFHGDAAVVRAAAVGGDRSHLVLVVPELLTGNRVDGVDVVEGGRQEHHAVDHDRRGLHRLAHFRLENERRPQLADVAGVDLLAGVVAAVVVVAVRMDPVLGVPRAPSAACRRNRHEIARHRLGDGGRRPAHFLRLSALHPKASAATATATARARITCSLNASRGLLTASSARRRFRCAARSSFIVV